MKTAMTQEDKKAFYAQYYGQLVLQDKINGLEHIDSVFGIGINESYLQLKPISSITDDDAIEVARRYTYHEVISVEIERLHTDEQFYRFIITRRGTWPGAKKTTLRLNFYEVWDHTPCADFLRSRGYLLPFRNYTPDQILEMGWAKLQEV